MLSYTYPPRYIVQCTLKPVYTEHHAHHALFERQVTGQKRVRERPLNFVGSRYVYFIEKRIIDQKNTKKLLFDPGIINEKF